MRRIDCLVCGESFPVPPVPIWLVRYFDDGTLRVCCPRCGSVDPERLGKFGERSKPAVDDRATRPPAPPMPEGMPRE